MVHPPKEKNGDFGIVMEFRQKKESDNERTNSDRNDCIAIHGANSIRVACRDICTDQEQEKT